MDSLEEGQIQGLRKAFEAFDTDNKGAISVETVSQILRMMGIRVSDTSLMNIVKDIDVDGSGQLEFEEFCDLAAKFLIEEDEEALKKELKEAFRIYDRDGKGYINLTTLKEILHELDPNLTNAELQGIVEEVDEDGSGTLDFDEFVEMMAG